MEIKGLVFRVRDHKGIGWLFEATDEIDPLRQLKTFCAEKELAGHMITSATRIYADSKDTPRVAFRDAEYKQIIKDLRCQYRECWIKVTPITPTGAEGNHFYVSIPGQEEDCDAFVDSILKIPAAWGETQKMVADKADFRFVEAETDNGLTFNIGIPDQEDDTDLFLDHHFRNITWGEAY